MTKSSKTKLGKVLREARLRLQKSLRDVEREAAISNGYLSLLESDRVAQPSPRYLLSLARVYEISYGRLMTLAGYVPASADEFESQPTVTLNDLSEDECRRVYEFVAALRASKHASTYEEDERR